MKLVRNPTAPDEVAAAEGGGSGLEDLAAVREPVRCGPGGPLAAKHPGPVLKGQVGGHDQAGPLVGIDRSGGISVSVAMFRCITAKRFAGFPVIWDNTSKMAIDTTGKEIRDAQAAST